MAEVRDHTSSPMMAGIVRTAAVAVTIALFVASTFNAFTGQRDVAILFALATPLGISALGFGRAGHNEAALMLLCGVLVVVVTLVLILSPFGVHDVIIMAYAGVVLMGALLLSRQHFYAITALIVAAGSLAFVMEFFGLTHSRIARGPGWPALVEYVMMVVVFAGIGRYAAEKLFGSLGDVRRATNEDAVSGVASRPAFLDHAGHRLKAMPANSHAMLALVDLDGFRRMNVVIGHRAADNVLHEVAVRLSAVPGIETVGRIGDDEFAAMACGLSDEPAALALARGVHQALQFDFAGVTVRTSVGFARYPRDADTFDALLRAAEGSLTRAKDDEKERFAGPGDSI
jgi:diguanylate cyclase (GGDEF)-like protein